jgi:hypothetical protein
LLVGAFAFQHDPVGSRSVDVDRQIGAEEHGVAFRHELRSIAEDGAAPLCVCHGRGGVVVVGVIDLLHEKRKAGGSK